MLLLTLPAELQRLIFPNLDFPSCAALKNVSSRFRYDEDLKKETARALLDFERTMPPPPLFHHPNHDVRIRRGRKFFEPDSEQLQSRIHATTRYCFACYTCLRIRPARFFSISKISRAYGLGHSSCPYRICYECAAKKKPGAVTLAGQTMTAEDTIGALTRHSTPQPGASTYHFTCNTCNAVWLIKKRDRPLCQTCWHVSGEECVSRLLICLPSQIRSYPTIGFGALGI